MKQNDIYTEVNKSIIELLKNPLKFENSWINIRGGMPRNIFNHRKYRGVNVFLLSLETFERGWAKPTFLTFSQVNKLNARVKKGEKSSPIYFYDFFYLDRSNTKYQKEQVNTMSEAVKKALEIRKISYLKTFKVFNVVQCEGLPPEMYLIPEIQNISPVELNLKAEEILTASGAVINISVSNAAFYNHTSDTIQLPDLRQFKDTEGFYTTVFHELAHWTGHENRLNRFAKYSSYTEKGYAFEELVAELTAAYMCAVLGFQSTITNNAAYIQNWLTALENETHFFVAAAKRAEEASNYLLNKWEVAESENRLAA